MTLVSKGYGFKSWHWWGSKLLYSCTFKLTIWNFLNYVYTYTFEYLWAFVVCASACVLELNCKYIILYEHANAYLYVCNWSITVSLSIWMYRNKKDEHATFLQGITYKINEQENHDFMYENNEIKEERWTCNILTRNHIKN